MRLLYTGVVVATAVAVLLFSGLVATWAIEDSRPGPAPSASAAPPLDVPAVMPVAPPRAPFPSDDRGFLDSSARCRDGQSAKAIGRTSGSLVVICGEQPGSYEYLGVRLSDEAVLRTDAQTDSPRSFLAKKAGVLYTVSPTELKVTAGDTVIKQEPMISYREVA